MNLVESSLLCEAGPETKGLGKHEPVPTEANTLENLKSSEILQTLAMRLHCACPVSPGFRYEARKGVKTRILKTLTLVSLFLCDTTLPAPGPFAASIRQVDPKKDGSIQLRALHSAWPKIRTSRARIAIYRETPQQQ